MDLPHSRVRVTASQSKRRATGSMPVEGSSRKITGGPPMRAMPALSFRLLPPLQEETGMGTETRYEHSESHARHEGQRGWGVSTSPLTCRSSRACQHGAPGAALSACSPHSCRCSARGCPAAGRTCSGSRGLSCGPVGHRTAGSSRSAAGPWGKRNPTGISSQAGLCKEASKPEGALAPTGHCCTSARFLLKATGTELQLRNHR